MLYLCTQDSLKIGEARAAKRTGKKEEKNLLPIFFPNPTAAATWRAFSGWHKTLGDVTGGHPWLYIYLGCWRLITSFLNVPRMPWFRTFLFLPSLLLQIQNTLPFLPLFIHASHSPRLHFSACLNSNPRFFSSSSSQNAFNAFPFVG